MHVKADWRAAKMKVREVESEQLIVDTNTDSIYNLYLFSSSGVKVTLESRTSSSHRVDHELHYWEALPLCLMIMLMMDITAEN